MVFLYRTAFRCSISTGPKSSLSWDLANLVWFWLGNAFQWASKILNHSTLPIFSMSIPSWFIWTLLKGHVWRNSSCNFFDSLSAALFSALCCDAADFLSSWPFPASRGESTSFTSQVTVIEAETSLGVSMETQEKEQQQQQLWGNQFRQLWDA